MLPDKQGHFGQFGGRFVPETLMPALLELEAAYGRIRRDTDLKRSWPGCSKITWAGPRRYISPGI